MDELPLFVFGTLRRGEENHHYLAGRYDRMLPGAVRGFRRGIARHGFPSMLTATADEQVTGELFYLSPHSSVETLRRCDDLEDIPHGTLVGEYYRRAEVQVETADGPILAWAYIDPSCPIDPSHGP